MELRPSGAGFDAFDKELAWSIRVGRLVEQPRFEASSSDLPHSGRQQNDIKDGGRDSGVTSCDASIQVETRV